jgi:hypothetical protein
MLIHQLDARMKGADRGRRIFLEELPETPEKRNSAVYNTCMLVTA